MAERTEQKLLSVLKVGSYCAVLVFGASNSDFHLRAHEPQTTKIVMCSDVIGERTYLMIFLCVASCAVITLIRPIP